MINKFTRWIDIKYECICIISYKRPAKNLQAVHPATYYVTRTENIDSLIIHLLAYTGFGWLPGNQKYSDILLIPCLAGLFITKPY